MSALHSFVLAAPAEEGIDLLGGIGRAQAILTAVIIVALLWLLVKSLFTSKGNTRKAWNESLAALIPTVVIGGLLIGVGALVLGPQIIDALGL